jgi:hypothetical protein
MFPSLEPSAHCRLPSERVFQNRLAPTALLMAQPAVLLLAGVDHVAFVLLLAMLVLFPAAAFPFLVLSVSVVRRSAAAAVLLLAPVVSVLLLVHWRLSRRAEAARRRRAEDDGRVRVHHAKL